MVRELHWLAVPRHSQGDFTKTSAGLLEVQFQLHFPWRQVNFDLATGSASKFSRFDVQDSPDRVGLLRRQTFQKHLLHTAIPDGRKTPGKWGILRVAFVNIS